MNLLKISGRSDARVSGARALKTSGSVAPVSPAFDAVLGEATGSPHTSNAPSPRAGSGIGSGAGAGGGTSAGPGGGNGAGSLPGGPAGSEGTASADSGGVGSALGGMAGLEGLVADESSTTIGALSAGSGSGSEATLDSTGWLLDLLAGEGADGENSEGQAGQGGTPLTTSELSETASLEQELAGGEAHELLLAALQGVDSTVNSLRTSDGSLTQAPPDGSRGPNSGVGNLGGEGVQTLASATGAENLLSGFGTSGLRNELGPSAFPRTLSTLAQGGALEESSLQTGMPDGEGVEHLEIEGEKSALGQRGAKAGPAWPVPRTLGAAQQALAKAQMLEKRQSAPSKEGKPGEHEQLRGAKGQADARPSQTVSSAAELTKTADHEGKFEDLRTRAHELQGLRLESAARTARVDSARVLPTHAANVDGQNAALDSAPVPGAKQDVASPAGVRSESVAARDTLASVTLSTHGGRPGGGGSGSAGSGDRSFEEGMLRKPATTHQVQADFRQQGTGRVEGFVMPEARSQELPQWVSRFRVAVVKAAQDSVEKGRHAVVEFRDSDLGHVRMDVSHETGGRVRVEMWVEQDAARQWLRDSRHVLEQELARQKLHLEQFDVGGQARGEGGLGGKGRGRTRSAHRGAPVNSGVGSEEVSRPRRHAGQLDVVA